MSSFGTRLAEAIAKTGRLCVGIDPHPYLLHEWGLEDSAEGAQEFGLRVVEAARGNAGVVKPQVAFFERFGSRGYSALEVVLHSAREAGLIVIADAKRGDVGSTVEAYCQSWLTPGSPLEADAMTISAFQGVGSFEGPMSTAAASGKGLFVLAATSNPESVPIQRALVDPHSAKPRSVSRVIVDEVMAFNSKNDGAAVGSIGVVLGATLDLASYGLDCDSAPHPVLPVLAPGFGHQGAQIADAERIFGPLFEAVLISESRSLLAAGPRGIAEEIAKRAMEVTAFDA